MNNAVEPKATIAKRSIPVSEVRKNLSQLIEQAHYQDQAIRIVRQNKTMAVIVGSNFMQALERLLEKDSALRETFEILMSRSELEDILASYEEYREHGAPFKLVEQR